MESTSTVSVNTSDASSAGVKTIDMNAGLSKSVIFETTHLWTIKSRHGIEKPGLQFSTLFTVYKDVPWLNAVVNYLSKSASKVEYNIKTIEGKSGADKQKSEIENFLQDPSEGEETFGDIIDMCIKDVLVFDAHGLEVVPAMNGTPAELINVSGITLKPDYSRVKRRVVGYYHELPEEKIKVYFKAGKIYQDEIYEVSSEYKLSNHPFSYLKLNPWAHRHYGLSPIESITNELATEISMGKSNANFFQNRARPDGYITGLKTRKEAEAFQEYWKQFYKGPSNSGKTPILYGGDGNVKYIPYPEMRKEWDIALQKWSLKKICAAFGVTDTEIGGEKTENRATAQVRHEIAKNCAIAFILSRFQNRINKLLLPLFFDEVKCEFKFKSVDNQDLAIMTEIYTKLLDRGVVTINEIRNSLGLGGPVEWGDIPLKSVPKFLRIYDADEEEKS